MSERFNVALGERIRTRRESKMTQAELAERIGLSRTSVTNIERGRQRLLVDQLVEIAKTLSVSPAELLPPPDPIPPKPSASVPDLSAMPTVALWLSQAGRRARR